MLKENNNSYLPIVFNTRSFLFALMLGIYPSDTKIYLHHV